MASLTNDDENKMFIYTWFMHSLKFPTFLKRNKLKLVEVEFKLESLLTKGIKALTEWVETLTLLGLGI